MKTSTIDQLSALSVENMDSKNDFFLVSHQLPDDSRMTMKMSSEDVAKSMVDSFKNINEDDKDKVTFLTKKEAETLSEMYRMVQATTFSSEGFRTLTYNDIEKYVYGEDVDMTKTSPAYPLSSAARGSTSKILNYYYEIPVDGFLNVWTDTNGSYTTEHGGINIYVGWDRNGAGTTFKCLKAGGKHGYI